LYLVLLSVDGQLSLPSSPSWTGYAHPSQIPSRPAKLSQAAPTDSAQEPFTLRTLASSFSAESHVKNPDLSPLAGDFARKLLAIL
jgi:hypothetical protein